MPMGRRKVKEKSSTPSWGRDVKVWWIHHIHKTSTTSSTILEPGYGGCTIQRVGCGGSNTSTYGHHTFALHSYLPKNRHHNAHISLTTCIYTSDMHTFNNFGKSSERRMAEKSTCKNIPEEANLPITEIPSKYRANYGQIRYFMKRLNTALHAKIRDGRPCKYCQRCGIELRSAKLSTLKIVMLSD